jgi:excisionase family DNA binding protein
VAQYRYLTTNEAAWLLDVNPSRVRQLIAEGALPAEKRGRDWWIRERDVRAYMALPRGKPGRPRVLRRPESHPERTKGSNG